MYYRIEHTDMLTLLGAKALAEEGTPRFGMGKGKKEPSGNRSVLV